jgi:hypothetical protein
MNARIQAGSLMLGDIAAVASWLRVRGSDLQDRFKISLEPPRSKSSKYRLRGRIGSFNFAFRR